jgi:hypothetical protein
VSCTNVNECTLGTDNCDANAACADTDGSFTCTCNPGFTGDGVSCTNVNECTLGTDNCAANAACADTAGSFTCTCNSGFSGNGFTCADINECNNKPCSGFNFCKNNTGGFECVAVPSQCGGSTAPPGTPSSCYHCLVAGTFVFTVPDSWSKMSVKAHGAGGGSGLNNCFGNKCFFGSGGGGGGGFAHSNLGAVPGNSFSFTVGLGAGGGQVGGKTSFNSDQLFATGGSPGVQSTDAGGAGGQGFKGNVANLSGGNGGSGGTSGGDGIFKFGSKGNGVNGVGDGAPGDAAQGGFPKAEDGGIIICPN